MLASSAVREETGSRTPSTFASPSRWGDMRQHRAWSTVWEAASASSPRAALGGLHTPQRGAGRRVPPDDSPSRLRSSASRLRSSAGATPSIGLTKDLSGASLLQQQRFLIAEALEGAAASPRVWARVGSPTARSPRRGGRPGGASPLSSVAINRLTHVAAEAVEHQRQQELYSLHHSRRWPDVGPRDDIDVYFRVPPRARGAPPVVGSPVPLPRHTDALVDSELLLESLRRERARTEVRMRQLQHPDDVPLVGVDMSTNREAQLGADARVWSRLGVSSAGEEESEGAPSLRPATRPLPFQTMVDYSGFDTRTGRPSTMGDGSIPASRRAIQEHVQRYYQRQAMPRWQREVEDATHTMSDATLAEKEVVERLGSAYQASIAKVVLARREGAAASDVSHSPRRPRRRMSYQTSAAAQRSSQQGAARRLSRGLSATPIPYSSAEVVAVVMYGDESGLRRPARPEPLRKTKQRWRRYP